MNDETSQTEESAGGTEESQDNSQTTESTNAGYGELTEADAFSNPDEGDDEGEGGENGGGETTEIPEGSFKVGDEVYTEEQLKSFIGAHTTLREKSKGFEYLKKETETLRMERDQSRKLHDHMRNNAIQVLQRYMVDPAMEIRDGMTPEQIRETMQIAGQHNAELQQRIQLLQQVDPATPQPPRQADPTMLQEGMNKGHAMVRSEALGDPEGWDQYLQRGAFDEMVDKALDKMASFGHARESLDVGFKAQPSMENIRFMRWINDMIALEGAVKAGSEPSTAKASQPRTDRKTTTSTARGKTLGRPADAREMLRREKLMDEVAKRGFVDYRDRSRFINEGIPLDRKRYAALMR